ncbi:peroxiredoxin family protein [Vibrio ostreicida]|uniref:Redoxin domain-containing protein n=1 Tax=Vibrio ostreicida TaxID=526588 RepID=A0ABT8BXD8_9VIBR|nr:redoxin domain-containing protein [Vibrio ostreicida]MDN3611831.1 redoxin domain-containing protein [Vibrio ostreicida]NPD09644.1 redoxin domain-containing protein [Vibrio ostreicida]
MKKLITLGALAFSFSTLANPLATELRSIDDHALSTDEPLHLVFFNIWDNYDPQAGALGFVSRLPNEFKRHYKRVWIQPDMNITLQQMKDYQGYFPTVTPLILDKQFSLMKHQKIWTTPHHILLEDGKMTFSGTSAELSRELGLTTDAAEVTVSLPSTEPKGSGPVVYKRLKVGEAAPLFVKKTLQGQALSLSDQLTPPQARPMTLVFLDAMCPMPHYPDCEEKIARLNMAVASDESTQWLGVISPFYINENIASEFAARMKLDLPLVFDYGNEIFRAYGVHATPYQIKLTPAGTVASRGNIE